MQYRIFIMAFFTSALFMGCAENKTETPAAESAADVKPMPQNSTVNNKPEENKLKDVVYALKIDPVCQMPITAGVSDTAIYENKVYGFCAPECKEDFKKDPQSFLAKK
jgi:YHS domain-containing protein